MPTKPPASFYTTKVALGADVATALYGVTGAGQNIGIISDSFNATGGYATDVANGIAPANVKVLGDAATGSDEGRAMLELAYSIAPGANYSTAEGNPNGLGAEVTALQSAGATIIADDLSVGGEGLYQNGSATDVAISAAVAANVDYFTSAGNNGISYYEQGFTPLATTIAGIGAVTANNFGSNSPYLSLTIENGSKINPIFQFAQPFRSFGNGATSPTNSLAIYLLNANGNIVASSTVNDVGGNPTQGFSFTNTTSSTDFRLVVVQNGGTVPAGQLFKLLLEDGGATINNPNAGKGSGDLLGHELLPGVNSVGAVNQVTAPANGGSPTVETFSSIGPGSILFDAQGNPLATPITVGDPQFDAPDATLTGSANTNFASSAFFGTSAAAPSAAAVAALILQADPTLSTTQVTALLLQTVIPVLSVNANAGAGLIQARAGVEIAAADAGDRWKVAAGGNWTTAASWSGGSAPTSAQAVSLSDNLGSLTSSYTVTVNTSGDTAGSIAISAPTGSSATLLVATSGKLAIGPVGATNTAPTATDITSGDLLVSDNGTLSVTGGNITETGSLNVNNGTVTVSLGSVTANNYAENSGQLIIGGGTSAASVTLTGSGFAETGGNASILAQGKLTATSVLDTSTLTIAGTVIDTGNLTNLGTGNAGTVLLQTGGELDVGGASTGVGVTFVGNGLLDYTSANATIQVHQLTSVLTGLAAGNGKVDLTGLTYNSGDTFEYFSDNGQVLISDQNGMTIANLYLNTTVNYTGLLKLQSDGASNHVEVLIPAVAPTVVLASAPTANNAQKATLGTVTPANAADTTKATLTSDADFGTGSSIAITTGNLIYTPGVVTAAKAGSDVINYVVTDTTTGASVNETQTVTLSNGPPPVITLATASSASDAQPATLGTAAPGVTGDALVVTLTSDVDFATGSSVTLSNGNLIYTPGTITAANAGSDTLKYSVTDSVTGAVTQETQNVTLVAATTGPNPPVTIGSGPQSFVLNMSEDAYMGNAQFTVAVNGTQVGAPKPRRPCTPWAKTRPSRWPVTSERSPTASPSISSTTPTAAR